MPAAERITNAEASFPARAKGLPPDPPSDSLVSRHPSHQIQTSVAE